MGAQLTGHHPAQLQVQNKTFFLHRVQKREYDRISLICQVLIAICVAAPVSAFVDRNGVTTATQFKDYVPASYLTKAGVTDGMTVDRALDAYITYALSFSD